MCVAAKLERKELETRVETNDELAAPRDDSGCEPVGERRRRCRNGHTGNASAKREGAARSDPLEPLPTVRRLVAAALHGCLELAAGRELRHRRRGDVHLLAGARVDPHARRAI